MKKILTAWYHITYFIIFGILQKGERQVDQDIADGNILEFDSLEKFFDNLKKVDKWK